MHAVLLSMLVQIYCLMLSNINKKLYRIYKIEYFVIEFQYYILDFSNVHTI